MATKTKKNRWNSSEAIIADSLDLFDRTMIDEVSCEKARIGTQILRAVAKMVQVEMTHAKLSGRIRKGSKTLPGFIRK